MNESSNTDGWGSLSQEEIEILADPLKLAELMAEAKSENSVVTIINGRLVRIAIEDLHLFNRMD